MIYRDNHNNNFTTVSNEVIRSEMSDGAKVLLLFMLSCSDDWNFSVKGLSFSLSLSESTIKTRLKELRDFGFVVVKKLRDEKGRFGEYTWDVLENPVLRGTEFPTVEKNRRRKKPTVGKTVPIRNTNIKEIPNNKEIPKRVYGEFFHVLLTDAEYQKLTERFGESVRDSYIAKLDRYIENYPKKGSKYKSHYSTILTWHDGDQKKATAPQPITPKRQFGFDEAEFRRLINEEARKRGEL